MSYPKTIITKTFRRIFFYFLVTIFFVSAPILIMYSIGYSIDLSSMSIIETGVISIDLQPKDATVYISGIKINKKLPLRLTNRMPGTYALRIEKLGYKTWEKNIDVKSKQTTYIKDINLLRDMLPVPIFEKNDPLDKLGTNKKITSIHPSANGNFLILVREQNDSKIIELLNLQTKDIYQIFRKPLNINYSVEWSPYDDFILIPADSIDNSNTKTITMLSADNPDIIKTYTLQKDNYANHFEWQKEAFSPTVFTREGENLLRITMDGYEKIYSIKNGDEWYVDALEKLWLNDGKDIYLTSANEDPSTSLRTSKNKIAISDLDENIEKIVDINEYRVIIKTEHNVIVVPKNTNKMETITASSMIYNPATKEWIVWSPWELWSIYENSNIALLNRTSDNITSVFPLDNVGVLIVVNKDGITSFNPGYYVSQTIFKGEVKTATVNQKNKTIYFLGKINDNENLFELGY